MKVSIKIILTIVAIIVATFIIGVFKAITGDYSSSPNTAVGIFLIISIITIWSIKPKNIKANKEIDKSKQNVTKKPNENTACEEADFSNQKKNILELRNANILTDTEYNEKLIVIENKEKVLFDKLKVDAIKKEEQLQKDKLITKLDELLKDGILSQTEYLNKKSLIISGAEKIEQVIPPPKLIEQVFLKNGYTLKMGKHKVFKLRFDNKKSMNVYQKCSNSKYFIYGFSGILVFPDLELLVDYIINKMMD